MPCKDCISIGLALILLSALVSFSITAASAWTENWCTGKKSGILTSRSTADLIKFQHKAQFRSEVKTHEPLFTGSLVQTVNFIRH